MWTRSVSRMLSCYGEIVPVTTFPTPARGSKRLNGDTLCSCKPQIANTILSEPGMKEALEGKLLISILAGVTILQLQGMVLPSTKVVRAMPNTPCKVRSASTHPPPSISAVPLSFSLSADMTCHRAYMRTSRSAKG